MIITRLNAAIRHAFGILLFGPLVAWGGLAAAQTLPSFEDDEELRAFLAEIDEAGEVEDWLVSTAYPPPPPPPPPPPSPSPGSASATASASASDTFTASPVDNPDITNAQVAGVDEGGIVKVAGDYLIVLRRGRLFTISTANDDLVAIDRIDAFPPDVDGSNSWYDEMIVSGDLIVIIGYSYLYESTEISRFRIALDGQLSHVDTHHMRSDDYYSSRNYASRLIGDQLITYAPLAFDLHWGEDPLDSLPGLSRWIPGQEAPDFRRLAQASDVYIPGPMRARGAGAVSSMHVVTRCDLTSDDLDCEVSVVLGPAGRSFFVSRNATYVWVTPGWNDREGESYLYRIPLNGNAPSVARVEGAPLDQFSFYANEAAIRLDILVMPDGAGDGMWAAEGAVGRPALLRLPTTRFGDGSQPPLPSDYQILPVAEQSRVVRNRHVGDTLVVGLVERGTDGAPNLALTVALEGGDVTRLALEAPVSRIEAIGQDALIVTQAGGTRFVTVSLTGEAPEIADRFLLENSAESESRSHAFFFRPDGVDGDGLAALPLLAGGSRDANMVYLQREAGRFSWLGRLDARARPGLDDGCQASCADWYGNARPIFLRDRILTLLGYEIIEGRIGEKRIEEVGRVDFSPGPRKD